MTLETPTDGKIAEYNATEQALAELRTKYSGAVYDLSTTKGDKEARAARKELVSLRTGLEAKRKTLKAPALEYAKRIDTEAKRIESEIAALEEPIDQQIRADEARREAERVEKQRIEEARIAGIHQKVAALRARADEVAGKGSAAINAAWSSLTDFEPTDEEFAEFVGLAKTAQAETLARLQQMHGAAEASEAEAARLVAEREELNRLRAEQAERERQEAAARAKAEADAKAQREAEEARLKAQRDADAARLRAEREAFEAEQRKQREEMSRQQAEIDRQRREQEAAAEKARQEHAAREAAEAKRLATEKADNERKEREAQDENARRKREAARPSDDELADVIANHYRISAAAAHRWLGHKVAKAA